MISYKKNLDANNTSYLYPIISILAASFIYFILKSFVPLPEDTHFFASHFDQINNWDIVRYIYDFINTPSMALLASLYEWPFWYGITSYAAEVLFAFLLLLIIYKECNNIHIATLSLLIFSPLVLATAHYSIIQFFPFIDLFFIKGAGAFDWGWLNLSPRLVFAFFFSLAIHFFLKERYWHLYLSIILMIIVHSNKGLMASAIILISILILVLTGKISYKKLLLFIIAMLIGILPLIFKLASFPDVENIISNALWYENMIRDEADDFSFLWVFVFFKKSLITYCVFWLITLWAYKRLVSNNICFNPLWLMVFVPQSLFVILSVLEFLSVYYENFMFIRPVISLTANMHLLGFTFLPSLIVWSKILVAVPIIRENAKTTLKVICICLSICLFTLITIFADSSGFNKKVNYFTNIYGLGPLRNYSEIDNLRRKFIKPSSQIYIIPKNDELISDMSRFKIDPQNDRDFILNLSYDNQYIEFKIFEELLDSIRKNISPEVGIITPPYMTLMRESLGEYDIFFQESHDGNLMLGSAKFSTILLGRMKSLLGHTYIEIPSLTSGYQKSFIRDSYLKIKEVHLKDLKTSYPKYNIFITEKSHLLDLRILYKDENYIFYIIE